MDEAGTARPESTIEAYIEACRFGDVESLKSLFAPAALMSGYFQGEFYIGPPDLFYDEVRNNPSPSETGAEYGGEIITAETYGDIATITLKEHGYLGFNLVNLFHLARIDGTWLIVSKTYIDE